MFTISYPKTERVHYIRHPSYENLFVLPYLNGRLVFAELAARAVLDGQFDVVLVDLPCSLVEKGWLDIFVDAFPLVSALSFASTENQFRTYHFAPNDAASISAYLARWLQKGGSRIEFKCIDDSNISHYPSDFFRPPRLKFGDDHFAIVDGCDTYFSEIYKQLELLWDRFSVVQNLLGAAR